VSLNGKENGEVGQLNEAESDDDENRMMSSY